MRKRTFLVAAVGLVAVLVAGGLFASNMGYKLNYALEGQGVNNSNTGTTSLALPYNQQTDLLDAEGLLLDINATGGGVANQIARLVKSTDNPEVYTGFSGTNFLLVPGEGYQVKVDAGGTINYIIVGSHNPALGIDLDGQGTNGSNTGTTRWSYPYHSTAANAEDLIMEINAFTGVTSVLQVARLIKSTDGLEVYTGFSGTNFTLTPGEAYDIKVDAGLDVTAWIPSHF